MPGSAPVPADGAPGGVWEVLRRRARVYPPEPPGRPGVCAVCRGPASPGYARCYQCARHERLGPDLLADAVVPISYAVKGTAFAADLWRYKAGPDPGAPGPGGLRPCGPGRGGLSPCGLSPCGPGPGGRSPGDAARASLLALLLAFLHDHAACVWRQAGMAAPGHLAVVPTGCGRPGPHPLLELAAPYLRLRPAPLVIRPGRQGRDPDPARFHTERGRPGANVLLLEDSWVSGASAQSAAAALKRAGARRVALVVLGRHLDPADRLGGPLAARLVPGPCEPGRCAVHAPRQRPAAGTGPGAAT